MGQILHPLPGLKIPEAQLVRLADGNPAVTGLNGQTGDIVKAIGVRLAAGGFAGMTGVQCRHVGLALFLKLLAVAPAPLELFRHLRAQLLVFDLSERCLVLRVGIGHQLLRVGRHRIGQRPTG